MKIEQYQIEAKRTCPTLGSYDKDMTHMRLGIFTECGELLDAIKKNYAYGKPLDLVNVGEEIGDIAWYFVNEMTFKNVKAKIKPQRFKSPQQIEEVITVIVELQTLNCHFNLSQLINVANYFNLDFYELLDKNIAKLKARYPEKFTTENALNRI